MNDQLYHSLDYAKWLVDNIKGRNLSVHDLHITTLAAEIIRLCDEVGTLPEGNHPDEVKPRAATWLDERRNWEAEVAHLRAENDQLRQDRLDYSSAVTTEGMNASEWIWRAGKAEREAKRLLAELGAKETTLKIAERCIEERDAARAENEELREGVRVIRNKADRTLAEPDDMDTAVFVGIATMCDALLARKGE